MNPSPTSRRQVLRTTGIAAAAAAVLVACGKEADQAGLSGTPPVSTSTTPPVPTKPSSTEDLVMDTTLLRTGTSLELLAAKLYDDYGPKLESGEWKQQAERFGEAHRNSAATFQASTAASKRVDKPNKYVLEQGIDPLTSTLTNDAAILSLFHDMESTIAATYVDATGIFTTAAWRARIMTFGAASARRATVLGNGGNGVNPTDALYPLTDLISNDAYVQAEPKKADAAG